MKKITFGRLQDNDIVFDDQSVSRHHGHLLVEGSKVYVVDDDSLNGIFVNGRRIQGKVLLSQGDKVVVSQLFKLNWEGYAEVDKDATIRNNVPPRHVEAPSPKKEEPAPKATSDKSKAFWQTVGKYLKYIISTVVTMLLMALINKMIR